MGLTKVWCRNCKRWFEIDEDAPINEALPGHTWDWRDKRFQGRLYSVVRHLTHDDHLEEMADREICQVCGVPHGPNPYTGCELGA